MTRRFTARTIGVFAALLLASCFGDSTGPNELRRGFINIAPEFNVRGIHRVDVNRVLIRFTKPNSIVVVYDTLVPFPAADDTLDLNINVPINGSSEQFLMTILMIDDVGGVADTVFRAGPTLITATAGGPPPSPTPVTFIYVGVGANAAGVRFLTTPSSVLFGDTVVFTAEAFDSNNVTIPNTPIEWRSSDTTRARVPNDSVGRFIGGIVRGPVTITAALLTSPSATRSLQILPKPNAVVVQGGSGQTGGVGSPLAQPVTVRVNAADNLGVSAVIVNFAVVTGGGTLSQLVDTTDANGDASVIWTLGATLGAQSVSATVPGVTGGSISVPATGVVGTPKQLAFQVQPTNVAVAVAIAPPVQVVARDTFGNTVAGFTGNITVAIGANPGGSTLGGTTTVAAVAGVATFSTLTLTNLGVGYTLAASATGLTGATSSAFDVAGGVPTQLVVVQQPSNTTGGSAITPAITVQVRDALNNIVPGATNTVTVAIGNNPASGVLSGTASVAAVGGVATFSTLTIDNAGTGYTLLFGSTGLTSATSAAFDITAGPATVLIFTTQPPASAIFQSPFGTVVTARDAGGNVATSFTGAVTLGIGSNPAGGTLFGTATVNAVAGVATFSGISIDNIGAGYTLTANATGLAGAASGGIAVVAPANANAWINPAGGNWNTASNWSLGTVPSATDTVFIRQSGTYTVNLDVNATLARLDVGAPLGVQTLQVATNTLTMSGDGAFTTNGRLNVSGGTVNGAGTLDVFGGLDWTSGNFGGNAGVTRIAAGGTLTIGGTATRQLNNHVIELSGTGTWTGTQTINSGSAGTLRVQAAGVLNIQGDPAFIFNLGGTASRLDIQGGTVNRTTSTGVADMPAITNNGIVNVLAGQLYLSGGGTINGTFNVATGATLRFDGGAHQLNSSALVTGSGTVQMATTVAVDGAWSITGATQVVAGNANFNAGGTKTTTSLQVTGGTLGGNAGGLLSVSGAMTWSGGNLSGTGGAARVLLGGTLTVSGNGSGRQINNYILEVAGIGTWAPTTASMNSGSGATLRVMTGGQLDVTGDFGVLYNQGGAASRLVVQAGGTLRRTVGTGAVPFTMAADDSGSVDVQTGTLDLSGGGTSIGTFAVATGATLDFGGGTHDLLAASTVSGLGTVTVSGGTVNAGGNWTHGGTTQVNGGTLNYSAIGGATVNLNVSAGTLGGAAGGLLSVSGAMTWSGGNLSGAGGAARVLASGTLAVSGVGTGRQINNYILELAGTGTWAPTTASMNSGSGATLRVLTGGQLDVTGDFGILFNQGGATSRLVVQAGGTLRRTVGTGAVPFTMAADDSGSVDVQTGTLDLSGGGASPGAFLVSSGATLDFGGGTHNLLAASTVSGLGTVTVSGGTVNAGGNWTHGGTTQVNGGTLNYSATGGATVNLNVSAGTLGGAAGGLLSVSGAMTWSGGNLSGTGGAARVLLGGTLAVSGNGSGRQINNYILEVAGIGTWAPTTASMNSGSGATLRVLTGGQLDVTGDFGILFNQGGAASRLVVQTGGTLRRTTSANPVQFTMVADDSGTVNVQTGTLDLSGGGTSSGVFSISSGAALRFGGGTHGLLAASSATGAGSVQITAGTLNAAGGWSVTGTTLVSGGTANFNGTSMTTTGLTLSSGTLGGVSPGLLTVSGPMTWSGGNLSAGAGTTRVLSGGTLAVSGSGIGRQVNNYTLELAGTGSWATTTAAMNSGSGGTLRVLAGGQLDVTGDFAINYNQGGAASLVDNQGTFNRITSGGVVDFNLPFNNSGTVNVSTGTLELSNGGSQNGAIAVTGGAVLSYVAGTFNLQNGQNASGAGLVQLNGATLSGLAVGDTARFTNLVLNTGALNPAVGGTVRVAGVLDWAGTASLGGGGATFVPSGGTLTFTGTATRQLNNHTLENGGTATWASTFTLNSGGGAVIRNRAGGTFTMSGNGSYLYNQGGALSSFDNQGTFSRTTSAGTATLDVDVLHSGSASVTQGTLALTESGTYSAPIAVTSPGVVDYSGATHTFQALGGASGAGQVRWLGGTLATTTATDTARFVSLELVGGFVNPVGVVRVTGLLDWSNAAFLGGGGKTLVPVGGTLNLTGTATRQLNNHTLESGGTATWSGTFTLNSGGGAVLRNLATGGFTITGNGSYLYNQGGALSSFDNQGTFSRTTSAGTATLDVDVLHSGSATVTQGTLALTESGTYGAPIAVTSPGVVDFSGATHTFQALGGASGTGQARWLGGTLATTTATDTARFVSLELVGGFVNPVGVVRVTGLLDWSNAAFLGGGGKTLVPVGGTLNLTGTATRQLNNHTLENGGTATWSGTFTLNSGAGAVLRNLATGGFTITGDGSYLYNQGGATSVLDNLGTFTRSTNPGVAQISAQLSKTGSINVTSGTLRFSGGSGAALTGTATATTGTLDFNAGVFTQTGPVDVTGSMLVSGAWIPSGFRLTTTADLTISGGGLLPMTVATDSVDINGNATFGGGNSTLSTGVIRVAGNFTQTGTTSFRGLGGATRHRVVLDGAGTQVVNWADPVNSFFEILQYQKPAATQIQFVGNTRARLVNALNFNAVTLTSLGGATTPRLLADTLRGVSGHSYVSPLVLEIAGRIADSGLVNVDTVVFTGSNQVITDRLTLGTSLYQYKSIRVAQTTGTATLSLLSAPLALANDFVVSSGSLSLSGFRANVAGNFATQTSGNLTMTNAADTLDVNGDVSFGGITGTMSAGGIRVAGNFSQSGATNSFTPTATHKVYFDGTTTQNINFASGTSFFRRFEASATGTRNIVLQSNVTVTDSLTMLGGATGTDLIGAGTTQRLIVGGTVRLTQQTSSPRLATPVLEMGVAPNIDPIGIAGRGLTPDTAVYTAGVVTLPVGVGIRYNSIRVSTLGNFAMANDTIAVDLDITGTGTIVTFTGTNTFFMGGDLSTRLSAVYAQTGAGTRVTVLGDASFAGGTSTNINNGVLELRGNFTQGPTGSTNAFQASGAHTTLLSYGPGALRRTISFTNPGTTAANSRFGRLQIGRTIGAVSQPVSVELLTDVQAGFAFDTSTGATIDTIFTAGAAILTTDTLSISNSAFTTTRLILGNATTGGTFAHQMTGVTFSGMNTAQTFISIHRSPGAPAVQLASVNFASTPVAGLYFLANTVGAGGAPAITLQASNVLGPAGCAFVTRTGATLPTFTWIATVC